MSQLITKAFLSKTAIIITLIAHILFLYVCYLTFFNPMVLSDQLPENLKFLPIVIFFLILVLAYLFHPTKFEVNDASVIIYRPILNRKLAISEISKTEIIRADQLLLKIRLFGSGGIWGFFGIYYTRKYGILNIFTTDLTSNLLLIKMNNNKYFIINPVDSEKFKNSMYL